MCDLCAKIIALKDHATGVAFWLIIDYQKTSIGPWMTLAVIRMWYSGISVIALIQKPSNCSWEISHSSDFSPLRPISRMTCESNSIAAVSKSGGSVDSRTNWCASWLTSVELFGLSVFWLRYCALACMKICHPPSGKSRTILFQSSHYPIFTFFDWHLILRRWFFWLKMKNIFTKH